MADDVGKLFDRGLDHFGSVAAQLSAEDWDGPSRCEGWSALDVLGHLGSSLEMGISVMQGEQPSWPEVARPADLVDGEPSAYWDAIVERCRRALEGADLELVMDTPMGRRTVADRLAFPTIDLYVHAWDIGSAAGVRTDIPDDVIELAHAHIDPIPEEMVRGPKGAFGPEATAPADATPTEAFLAWTGRPPR